MYNLEGEVYKTNSGVDCVVLKYHNSRKVSVKFLDEFGFITETQKASLLKGNVRNKFSRSVYGVGYIGDGLHKPYHKRKQMISYTTWVSMLRRVYCKKSLARHPTYEGCSVHPDWHNFQNFAEWFVNHKFYGLGYELDKDLLLEGNKVYSENTCTLIPKEINLLLTDSFSTRGFYPQGVSLDKRTGIFYSSVSCFGKARYLGSFRTVEGDSLAYQRAKMEQVKVVAESWRGKIEDEVLEKLLGECYL